MKRTLLAGGAALVLGGSALGLALAQQAPPSPVPQGQAAPARPRFQAYLDALAQKLGIPSDRLQQLMAEARSEVGMDGGGHRGGGAGRRGGFGGEARGLGAAAGAIGIPSDQLRQELAGSSLAQVAQAHGRNPADVATALKNAANQRIDQGVTNGRLNADQASQMKDQAAQRIDQLMNQTMPQGGRGFRGPGAGGTGNGGPGFGGPRFRGRGDPGGSAPGNTSTTGI